MTDRETEHRETGRHTHTQGRMLDRQRVERDRHTETERERETERENDSQD